MLNPRFGSIATKNVIVNIADYGDGRASACDFRYERRWAGGVNVTIEQESPLVTQFRRDAAAYEHQGRQVQNCVELIGRNAFLNHAPRDHRREIGYTAYLWINK